MQTRSLRQQAYETIREWIAANRLPKGSVTSELQLCAMLNMSRTPIRAALQQLETDGFLRIAPKHGILILDSSAQRVGDLLDIVASLALYAFEQQRHSRPDGLPAFADSRLSELRALFAHSEERGDDNADALCRFELDMLHRLVSQCHNAEMERLLRTTSERLFWTLNVRRWNAPYRPETSSLLAGLLASMKESPDGFRLRLFAYVRQLKRTWT
ncbi:GntR family transcriptional regulator [Paenibacillus flagellatus]|uniref:HTH gntR-type domain-containing protein n=1 Tax=Paenibacillus flagellatus TaxID=2211139 RepID=A0A2V5K695_9BACL|nr:GntR family transcriptional regulator [Paenibacillus flagellatus]PYI54312.1 hypothetical protein DLM86_12615 [Paenibacillus flagellatus]